MFTAEDLPAFRAKVRALRTGSGNSRAIEVLDALIDAVAPVLIEKRVRPDEWEAAVRFLGETDPVMMRAVAWCLGLSQVVQEANSRIGPSATPECIEGPFHVPGAPELPLGAAMHKVDDGAEYLFLGGRVLSTRGGAPLAGAELDVWAADGRGEYSFFDPTQPEHNCRGRFRTDAAGRWEVFAPLPRAYHMDVGPMGAVLKLLGHQVWRPAHVHFILRAEGHEPLTTQLYFEGDPHLHDDPAIGVKDGLVISLSRQEAADALRSRGVNRPFHEGRFDFCLQAA